MIKIIRMWTMLIGTFVLALTSCDKTPHELSYTSGDIGSALMVNLNTTNVSSTPLNDVHLFIFDSSDKLVSRSYFAKMEDLALERTILNNGNYTILAVLNTEKDFNNIITDGKDINLNEFAEKLEALASKYPKMLSGSISKAINNKEEYANISISDGISGIGMSVVKLNLTYPSPTLPDYVATKGSENVQLRCVIEVYNKETKERVLRKEVFPTAGATSNTFEVNALLKEGSYNALIWSDFTQQANKDYHYNTSDIRQIKILEPNIYWANTDTRDCFIQNIDLKVNGKSNLQEITMNRPVAKYRLVADDVEQFKILSQKYGFPPINEVSVEIVYTSFLPSSYNLELLRPNDSQTNYKYTSSLQDITATTAQVGKDFILVNGDESSVDVTVVVKDKNGKIVNVSRGIKVNYKAGYLTTITGNFLTGGATGGSININTTWDEDFYVNF